MTLQSRPAICVVNNADALDLVRNNQMMLGIDGDLRQEDGQCCKKWSWLKAMQIARRRGMKKGDRGAGSPHGHPIFCLVELGCR